MPNKLNKSNLIGVILAAGKGIRMMPLTKELPKPLLPICNKPLLDYQIYQLKMLGINKLILVVGNLKDIIKKHLGDGSKFGMRITYVEQKLFLGIAHALGELEYLLKKPFILFLGDIYFESKKLAESIENFYSNRAHAVLVCKYEDDPLALSMNFLIKTSKNSQRVIQVVEKPQYTNFGLMGCGVYLFDPVIFDAIRQTPRTSLRDEYELTMAIQILIDMGYRVFASSTINMDVNLTKPVDLLYANLYLLKQRSLSKLIGIKSNIEAKVSIVNSVIGKSVNINKLHRVEDSLLFSQVQIEKPEFIYQSIVSKNSYINCSDMLTQRYAL